MQVFPFNYELIFRFVFITFFVTRFISLGPQQWIRHLESIFQRLSTHFPGDFYYVSTDGKSYVKVCTVQSKARHFQWSFFFFIKVKFIRYTQIQNVADVRETRKIIVIFIYYPIHPPLSLFEFFQRRCMVRF